MLPSLFTFDRTILQAAEAAEAKIRPAFAQIEARCQQTSEKVLAAFIAEGIGESHFTPSTGYGYDDRGRDALDRLYARIFRCEDALVRHTFVSGTHALATALFGVLRPGDRMLSVTGRPYDTLEETIGLRGEGSGSLREFGILYDEVPLTGDGKVDLPLLERKAAGCRMAYIQRSRGYSLRDSLSIEDIRTICGVIRAQNPQAVILVDNCYGEFVETLEPTEVGADLIAGSLIKNPGGGLARSGGYIAGRADLIAPCSCRLSAPGMGKEVGASLGETRTMMQGLFLAPHVVSQALKTAVFAAALFESFGYAVYPRWDTPRTDIIQAVALGGRERLIAFCQGIQSGSPIDALALPEPWDMPGYDSEVIMAAGAFTLGASIELSADAPLREPYAVYFQGGLTYETGRLGVLSAAQRMFSRGILNPAD